MKELEELEEIIDEFFANNNVKAGELQHFAIKCYNLGKLHKKCKEVVDKDNPYHIDYKRQTKIDFNENNS